MTQKKEKKKWNQMMQIVKENDPDPQIIEISMEEYTQNQPKGALGRTVLNGERYCLVLQKMFEKPMAERRIEINRLMDKIRHNEGLTEYETMNFIEYTNHEDEEMLRSILPKDHPILVGIKHRDDGIII